jgi:4-hydroxy-2-oxoheptanedioate aldolase
VPRVVDGFGLTVTARVPDIRASTINSYLDRGITGIWGPHIETAEEAQALVDACLFGPEGQRSFGGGRGNYYNNASLIDIPGSERTEYMRQTNANMLVLCQLESIRAFENLDAILEVKGFDGYVFGPNDLAQSMEKGSSLDFS